MTYTVLITTAACPHCGEVSELEVDETALKLWQFGELIQDAFPELNAAEREQIKTGWHPRCWAEVFGG